MDRKTSYGLLRSTVGKKARSLRRGRNFCHSLVVGKVRSLQRNRNFSYCSPQMDRELLYRSLRRDRRICAIVPYGGSDRENFVPSGGKFNLLVLSEVFRGSKISTRSDDSTRTSTAARSCSRRDFRDRLLTSRVR